MKMFGTFFSSIQSDVSTARPSLTKSKVLSRSFTPVILENVDDENYYYEVTFNLSVCESKQIFFNQY